VLFADERHVEVQATWGIDALAHHVPTALSDLRRLERTLKKRAVDVLAYFERPARLRPRVPQPHQLHRPIPARDRRLQTPTTPSIVKGRHSARRGQGCRRVDVPRQCPANAVISGR